MDRNPVLMLSSMISACVVGGLQRLTYSKESGYKRQDMQCPEMAREYNQEGMGWGDSNDRMKLARRTSCEMNLVSKRWDWRLFWGLMDIAITNAFVLYTFFHKTTTHSVHFWIITLWFYRPFCVRYLKIALGAARGRRTVLRGQKSAFLTLFIHTETLAHPDDTPSWVL